MKYKIERISDSLLVIKPKHWWNDPLGTRDVLIALTEISKDGRILSVCRLGGFFSAIQFLVVVEGK